MANCIRCGREILHGQMCADCQAATNATPGVMGSARVPQEHSRDLHLSVTAIIVGLCVAVYVAMALSGVSPLHPTTQQLIRWGANFGPLSLDGQPWRMLTSNYVHIGLLHIFFNMWCLWNLGKLAERVFPPWTYFFLYTVCGLAGSIASLWWHPMVVGAGASGAIFGLAGALIAVFYLGKLPIPQAAVKGTLKSLITFAGYNLLFGLTAGIDNFAHLGGLLAGLAFGAAVAKHVVARPEERRRWQLYASAGMVLVLLTTGHLVRRAYWREASSRSQLAEAQDLMKGVQGKQTDYDRLIGQLKQAIRKNPEAAQPHYLLARVYMAKNQPDDAIGEYQETLRLDPCFARAALGLADAYAIKGMQQEAQDAANQASGIAKSCRGS